MVPILAGSPGTDLNGLWPAWHSLWAFNPCSTGFTVKVVLVTLVEHNGVLSSDFFPMCMHSCYNIGVLLCRNLLKSHPFNALPLSADFWPNAGPLTMHYRRSLTIFTGYSLAQAYYSSWRHWSISSCSVSSILLAACLAWHVIREYNSRLILKLGLENKPPAFWNWIEDNYTAQGKLRQWGAAGRCAENFWRKSWD